MNKRIARLYAWLYALLCGSHPNVRPWHFQWSAVKDLYADLREALPLLQGRVLDVGCGGKPYRTWCTGANGYVGIDVVPSLAADLVIQPGEPWAFPDAAFDGLLCTQVLEHVTDLDHVVREMARVLRPGGLAVVTAPFIYSAHGLPYDFGRFTAEGLQLLLTDHFTVTTLRREGGIGSTLATLVLGWMQAYTTRSRIARLLQALLLPKWIGLCALFNLIAVVLDAVDPTRAFYGNVMVVAVRKSNVLTTPRDGAASL